MADYSFATLRQRLPWVAGYIVLLVVALVATTPGRRSAPAPTLTGKGGISVAVVPAGSTARVSPLFADSCDLTAFRAAQASRTLDTDIESRRYNPKLLHPIWLYIGTRDERTRHDQRLQEIETAFQANLRRVGCAL